MLMMTTRKKTYGCLDFHSKDKKWFHVWMAEFILPSQKNPRTPRTIMMRRISVRSIQWNIDILHLFWLYSAYIRSMMRISTAGTRTEGPLVSISCMSLFSKDNRKMLIGTMSEMNSKDHSYIWIHYSRSHQLIDFLTTKKMNKIVGGSYYN